MTDIATTQAILSPADELAIKHGCWFDERAADHAVEFFPKFLRHSKGTKFAGRPFELMDWQREGIIRPLFGWKREDGTRRYRIATVFIPKKNGKSTLCAGVGLYMTVADGEPGCESYSVATTRDQAKIVHNEAVAMVKSSPQLQRVLHVNRSTHTIAMEATNSFYRALSSDVGGTEGLNAHFLGGDEFHVWKGRAFWDALRYAGRARTQPLLFLITTAGSDTQSVCYDQYQYAKGVLNGDVDDPRFFAYIAEAPRDADWTAEATWYEANPALGTTIDVDEFAADCEEAKRRPTSQAAFKRYSLNQWVQADSPGLKIDDWQACLDKYGESDLEGQTCYAGLDLSQKHDFTALSLVFPDEDEIYRQLVYFWLPEETLADNTRPEEHRVWQRDGHIRATQGNTCDYNKILKDIEVLAEKFSIAELAFDPYNAEQLTQHIENDIGIPRVSFAQTMNNYSEPTQEYERLVMDGKMRHNGHPVLTWQAGHVQWKSDENGKVRPVRPAKGDIRTVDGIQASIMALGRAMLALPEEVDSVYDFRGVVSF